MLAPSLLCDVQPFSLTVSLCPATGYGIPLPTAGPPAGAAVAASAVDEYLSCSALARQHGLPEGPLSKRLLRWQRTAAARDWHENSDRRVGAPRYFYRLGAVKHILAMLHAKLLRPAG